MHFHYAFRAKTQYVIHEKIFTNCTLEYTLAMVDTTFREVNMENKVDG
jgi:hypothetical protein